MALPAFAAFLPTILAALEKWTEWARIKDAPDRIDVLEERIAVLESVGQRPAESQLPAPKKAPGRACPACGEYAQRRIEVCLDRTRSDVSNAKIETWACAVCGVVDEVEAPARR